MPTIGKSATAPIRIGEGSCPLGGNCFISILAGCGLPGPVTDLPLSCRRFHWPLPTSNFRSWS
jgi:hypothetical protein